VDAIAATTNENRDADNESDKNENEITTSTNICDFVTEKNLVKITQLPIDFSNSVRFVFKNLISPISPIFSYYIYSVDKNIRKFSRKKSGKYTFI